MKKYNVAILGGGDVASHLIGQLLENQDKFSLSYVLVKDINKPRYYDRYNIIKTNSLEDIVNDESVDIVVDCLPGIDLPKEAMLKAIKKQKTVVSCGKQVWNSPARFDLISAANEANVTIWLNSLLSNVFYDFNVLPIDLTHKTIKHFSMDVIVQYRYGTGVQTGFFIMKDLLKAIDDSQ